MTESEDLRSLSSIEIDEKRIDAQHELNNKIREKGLVEEAIYKAERSLADLKETKRKAGQSIRELTGRIKILDSLFWSAKNDNR